MSRHTQALADYRNRLFDRVAHLNPTLAADLREIKLDWYRIFVEDQSTEEGSETTKGDNATVFIYDEIGGSFGVDAKTFVEELNSLDVPHIEVRINSPGGSLFDSVAIYNALVRHPAKVTTVVDSLAASGASIIAMAGNDVEMMIGSQLMIHDALGMEMGNARDMQAMSTFLDRQSNNIATIYAAKAGGSAKEWRDMMLAETWMFADEAVKAGLATRIYEPKIVEEQPTEEEDIPTPVKPPAEAKESTKDFVGAEDVLNLMKVKHTLSNRGFKYAGAGYAPKPKFKNSAVSKYLSKISK